MIVDNESEWRVRNTLVTMLVDEKRKKMKELELEIFTLNFALQVWKGHPFKDK